MGTFLCNIGWHAWGLWRKTDEGNIINSHSKGIVGKAIMQERQCKRCNKIEVDAQQTTIYD